MVFDNRFIPLQIRPWIAPDNGRSHLLTNVFGFTCSRAYNKYSDEVPLPDIFGTYDLGALEKAVLTLGYDSPIKTEWQGARIEWALDGKFQGQGFEFDYQQAFGKYFSIGASLAIMRVHSWNDFFLKSGSDHVSLELTPNDILELDEMRRQIHEQIGIMSDHSYQRGFGDIDLYFRLGNYWNYALKFRSIQAGLRLGFMIPTAAHNNVKYPSWIPFGGNKHWGLYAAVDAIFELKEDIKCGVYARVSKRMSKVSCQRVPLACEPDNFGALVTNVNVDPGATYVFSPFVAFEGLRDGLGIRVFYTLTKHELDWWGVLDSTVTINNSQCNRTGWGSDYFTANVFYDFGQSRPDWKIYPILTFSWDIPASVLIAQTVAKTNKISLGVEVAF